jgi:hypothetical protein
MEASRSELSHCGSTGMETAPTTHRTGDWANTRAILNIMETTKYLLLLLGIEHDPSADQLVA